MKIEKLESYLGKRVKIKVLDERELVGVLVKTRTEAVKDNPNLYYYKPNFYSIMRDNRDFTFLFRASYVKSCKEVE